MRAFALLVALLIGFGSPAFAPDDVAAAQSVIRAQEQAFGRDDATVAYSHAAPAIKQARRAQPTARSPSASISSMPMARPGRRSIRWSSSPTAASRSPDVRY